MRGKQITASRITVGLIEPADWNRNYLPYIMLDNETLLCEPVYLSLHDAKLLRAALNRAIKRAEA